MSRSLFRKDQLKSPLGIVNTDISSNADINISKLDISGTADISTFLRGDGTWTDTLLGNLDVQGLLKADDAQVAGSLVVSGSGEFTGTVSGADAVNNDDFITKGQYSGDLAIYQPKLYYVFDGLSFTGAANVDTVLRQVPLQEDNYWASGSDDRGWGIEFEFRGSFASSTGDKTLKLEMGYPDSDSWGFVWQEIILSGEVSAQEFWIKGYLTKLSATSIRREIELTCGDVSEVSHHTITNQTTTNSVVWDLDSHVNAHLRLVAKTSISNAIVISTTRFTRYPLDGTYITNL